MVFRFRPLKINNQYQSLLSRGYTQIEDNLIERAIKNQMRSTYATDYINNVEAKRRFEEEKKHLVDTSHLKYVKNARKNTIEPNQQFEPFYYNNPFSYESLNIAPTRYGCNKNHQKAAIGIVPDCVNLH